MKSLTLEVLIIAALAANFGYCTKLMAQIYESRHQYARHLELHFNHRPMALCLAQPLRLTGSARPVNLGQKFWQTTIHIAETGGDTTAGTYSWLFTSGPTGNAYANKWAGVDVMMNVIQNYQYNNGADNTVALENDMFYTFNWEDIGYQASRAIVMALHPAPVGFTGVKLFTFKSYIRRGVMITAQLEETPSNEEIFYLVQYR
ncbi:MAG: hypothetical protein R2850_10595 [Bacteroidia bacterium]